MNYLRASVLAISIAIVGAPLLFSQTDAAATNQTIQNAETETRIAPDEGTILIDDTPASTASQSQGGITFWVVFRLVLVLGLSVAAIYGIVYGLKKLAHPAEYKDPHLRVIASTHLGSNRFVHIVAVGTKAWLVGSSDGGVQPIAEITDQETLDSMFLDESKKMSETGKNPLDFKSIFRRFVPQSKQENSNQHDPIDLNAERLRKQRERLRGLYK